MIATAQGVLLVPPPENGRKALNFLFSQETLRIVLTDQPDQQWELPLEELTLYLGGNNRSLLIISHPLLPGECYTHFEEPQKSFVLNQACLKEKIRASYQDQRLHLKKEWGILAAFLLLFGLLIAFRGPIFGGLAMQIPFSWEKKIADQVFSYTQEETQDKQAATASLCALLKPVFEADPHWNQAFTVHLSAKPELNAYATLGGHIFVTQGLIRQIESAEELLGVVAHEISHVKERHVIKSVVQSIGLFGLIQALFGDVSGLIAVFADQGGALLQLSYSRDLESEADKKAVDLLVRQGISPQGLITALERIEQKFKKQVQEIPGGKILDTLNKTDILNTHPTMAKRLQEVAGYIQKVAQGRNFPPVPYNLKLFQQQVDALY